MYDKSSQTKNGGGWLSFLPKAFTSSAASKQAGIVIVIVTNSAGTPLITLSGFSDNPEDLRRVNLLSK